MSESDVRDAVAAAAPAEDSGPTHQELLELARLPRNDYGNAQRLLARHGRDMMYVYGQGWYYWDGRRWVEDHNSYHAQRFAHETALGIADEIEAVEREGAYEFGGGEKAWTQWMADHRKWLKASGNSSRIKAMMIEAAPYIQQPVEALDAAPLLFNVENGTLDFRGDEVRLLPHRREHLITRMASARYDPQASQSVMLGFLGTIMPDPELQTFMQTWFGYCLTGDMGEQKLLLCHGGGRNGKSTLNNVLRAVFGEYATSLPFESLQMDPRKRGSEASPDIAGLPGKRLVFAAEPENSVRLSPAIIKRLTGGEPIKARKNFGDFFEFQPKFKLALSFNEKPTIQAQDDGTWRRPLLLPFEVKIPDEMVDKHIDAKLLAARDGVLNWLVDGLLLWKERGLVPPAKVVEATEKYRAENDPLGQFLSECVVRAPGKTVTGKLMYDAYTKWCDDNGMKFKLTNTKFGTLLPQRGYDKTTKGVVMYNNVSLAPELLEDTGGKHGW